MSYCSSCGKSFPISKADFPPDPTDEQIKTMLSKMEDAARRAVEAQCGGCDVKLRRTEFDRKTLQGRITFYGLDHAGDPV